MAQPTFLGDGNTPRRSDAQWAIEQKILGSLVDAASSGAGGAQVLQYTTTDPTADGITPTNQNSPAIAYKNDGSLPTFVWNTVSHVWQ